MTTFLILGAAGLVLVLVALVVGDVLDGALEGLAGDWVSTEIVGGFVSAFGFGAAAAEATGAPLPLSLAVGAVAGAAVAWLAARLVGLVRGGGTDGTPEADDVVGRDAVVVSDVPADGFGAVRLHLGGHTLRFNARAETPLPSGTRVYVAGVLSPTAVSVVPLENPPKELS